MSAKNLMSACYIIIKDNLLTGKQKIDLSYIKSSFLIYQLGFLNEKLIEVKINNLKLTRRWEAAIRVFTRMCHFFKTGVIIPRELLSTFQKKQN